MTVHDDDRPGDDVRSAKPARRRRGLVLAGAVGLAAALGAGGYFVTDHLRDGGEDRATTAIGEIDSIDPSSPPSATEPAPVTATPGRTSKSAPATSATVAPQVKKEIQAAREDAEKAGHPLRRALTATGAEIPVDTRTEKTAEGTIRITTAKGDLMGQQEQLLAADKGEAVGPARCTQNLRFSNSSEPRKIPTVLLCWRTSAKRSIVTMAVSRSGKPSSAASVAVIAREWAKLG